MSDMSIRYYFPFSRVKITKQVVFPEEGQAMITLRPDKRYNPICHLCGHSSDKVHSEHVRAIRDLAMALVVVRLVCWYRKIFCTHCEQIVVEDQGFVQPYKRVTLRLAQYIHQMCKVLTVSEVAKHVGLDWKTVKDIDKSFLEKEYGKTDYTGLRVLAVDEIAIRKGHQYMTVVLDYDTGRVVWMGQGRRSETLKEFFNGMTDIQKQKLEAIAMDMWDPYTLAVQESVPHVKIVFDLFHVVSAFSRVIDKVRIDEYKKASEKDRQVFKGSKYLLLKNDHNLFPKEKTHLKKLLALNTNITIVMILRDKLKEIWKYRSRSWAEKALRSWCAVAQLVDHPQINRFIKMLKKRSYGILNHCSFPIHTSRLEGVNNKIKVIKRKAYGFHDLKYFTLKVKQAFDH